MVLPLVTPVGANFIKDFPSQNTVNCDLIDNYAGPCLTSDLLGTYVPVLSAVTTPPTLGGGTATGFYYRIFDQVYVWGSIRFGAAMTAGSGVWTISLPFKAKTPTIAPSAVLASGPVVGNGLVWDNSATAGRQPVSAVLRTNQTLMFGLRMGSGAAAREVTHLAPIPWADQDGIKWSVRYQIDPL